MYQEVDCEKCKNYDEKCKECEHYERELCDYYEPYSDEELAEMEKKRWREAEDRLIENVIELDPEEAGKFSKVFEAARQFRTDDCCRGDYIPVHAGDDHLSACDTHVLAHLFCDIPPAVRGKNIVRIEDRKAYIRNGKVPWQGRTLESLTGADRRAPLSGAKIEIEGNFPKRVVVKLPGEEIMFNKKHFDLVMKTLEGDITLVYGGRFDGVIFEGANGRILVLPLRY